MTANLTPAARMAELKQNGFCIIENVADERLLDRTRACVDKALAEVDPDRLQKTKSPGSLIDSNDYPELADLIGNPRALAELDRMGLKDIKFWKAVIISKRRAGPPLLAPGLPDVAGPARLQRQAADDLPHVLHGGHHPP